MTTPRMRSQIESSQSKEIGPELLLAVADAAEVWWRSKKPIAWKRRKHFSNPTINCTTENEQALAKAVAARVALCEGR